MCVWVEKHVGSVIRGPFAKVGALTGPVHSPASIWQICCCCNRCSECLGMVRTRSSKMPTSTVVVQAMCQQEQDRDAHFSDVHMSHFHTSTYIHCNKHVSPTVIEGVRTGERRLCKIRKHVSTDFIMSFFLFLFFVSSRDSLQPPDAASQRPENRRLLSPPRAGHLSPVLQSVQEDRRILRPTSGTVVGPSGVWRDWDHWVTKY